MGFFFLGEPPFMLVLKPNDGNVKLYYCEIMIIGCYRNLIC